MHKAKKTTIYLLALVLIAGGYCFFALRHPEPAVSATINYKLLVPQLTSSQITWPSVGQSAVGILGTNIIDTNGSQTPAPTASTAKLITALMILKAKPLSLGQQGPILTLTQNDADIYTNYVAEEGSVVPVEAGEQISEYQLLEGMLLPSANNMADSLAIWAYGSLTNYSNAANKYVESLGLSSTHIGSDASGFSPSSVTTPHDLIKIGELVMQNPVLSQIVGESRATDIPLVGTITNVNSLIGKYNIVGIKTGNTDQDGGVFLSASKAQVNGATVTILTANMQAPTLAAALSDSVPLIQSAQVNFEPISLIDSGAQVGSYKLPWQKKAIPVIATSSLDTYAWEGGNIDSAINLNKLSYPATAGQTVGYATPTGSGYVTPTSTNLVLKDSFTKPSIIWRLLHP